MTREDLQKDLAEFKAQREQLIANVNGLAGIIQYLEAKLAQFDAAPSTSGQAE
jgi:hypothetical protein